MAISKVELLNDTGVTPGSYTFADLTIGSDGRITSASSNPSGGSIPVGGIIIWSGTIASIPSGWRLCDGSLGAPDLRDRFIIGAGDLYDPDDSGGSADAVVVSHSHTVTPSGSSFARFVVDDSDSPRKLPLATEQDMRTCSPL
jgi:hypothetical protein